jgi:tryptophan synthase alpha chain
MTVERITNRFAQTKGANRAALVTFVMAGDPDHATTAEILAALPAAGADIIELGMPFSDPMADGATIQAAGLRALAGGANMHKTLDLVRGFRAKDQATPLLLMGYYNPILAYGVNKFLADAAGAGVDGCIVVDLPPEEDAEFVAAAQRLNLATTHLATPTTDAKRLPQVLRGASGFLYYVSIAGITGTKSAAEDHIRAALALFRQHTQLPIAVGFGVRTAEQVHTIAAIADGVVVGSAIIDRIAANLDATGKAGAQLSEEVITLVKQLAAATHRQNNRQDTIDSLKNLVRPKIHGLVDPKNIPDNLWDKCPGCGAMLFKRELEENHFICRQCGHSMQKANP